MIKKKNKKKKKKKTKNLKKLIVNVLIGLFEKGGATVQTTKVEYLET